MDYLMGGIRRLTLLKTLTLNMTGYIFQIYELISRFEKMTDDGLFFVRKGLEKLKNLEELNLDLHM